jgi:hypothetical protein
LTDSIRGIDISLQIFDGLSGTNLETQQQRAGCEEQVLLAGSNNAWSNPAATSMIVGRGSVESSFQQVSSLLGFCYGTATGRSGNVLQSELEYLYPRTYRSS